MHTHTCTQTQTHTDTACTHPHTHPGTHTRMHTHTHAHTHTGIHTRMHAHTQAYTHTNTHRQTASTDMLHETEENVCVDGSLVGLVQHDDLVLQQISVDQTLPQQHAVRHVLDLRLRAGAVLKADGVAHLGHDKTTVTQGVMI